MKNQNPVAETLRGHKKSSTCMEEKKNIPTQYTGILLHTFPPGDDNTNLCACRRTGWDVCQSEEEHPNSYQVGIL